MIEPKGTLGTIWNQPVLFLSAPNAWVASSFQPVFWAWSSQPHCVRYCIWKLPNLQDDINDASLAILKQDGKLGH